MRSFLTCGQRVWLCIQHFQELVHIVWMTVYPLEPIGKKNLLMSRSIVIEFNLKSREDQLGNKVSALKGLKYRRLPKNIRRLDLVIFSVIILPFRYSENSFIG